MAADNTPEEYEKLKNADIRSVDPETAPDIRDLRIDDSLPRAERVPDLLRQMNGNPFVYRCGGILVKTTFAGSASLRSLLEDYLERLP